MIKLLLSAIVLVFAAGALRDESFAESRLRASYGSLAASQVVLPLGVRSGIFQRNGINLEAVYIAGRSVSALISGDVQFGFMGGPPAILARLSGADVVIIGGLNGLDQILISLPGLKRGTDLIGKRIGISRFGTTADYGARIALKKLKLQAQKDVTLIQIGDTPARIGGMLSGAIEGASLSTSEKELAARYGFNILADNAGVDFPGNAIVTTRAYLRSNRDEVKRFLRGVVDVIQLVKTQPERTKRMLQELYRQNDGNVIASRYETMLELFPNYPYLTKGAVQSFLEIVREEGRVKEPLDPEAFIEMSLLREIEKERKR
jgi:NitT/TauT family transport system substrate-binding protein